jgi:hypothetical protein
LTPAFGGARGGEREREGEEEDALDHGGRYVVVVAQCPSILVA